MPHQEHKRLIDTLNKCAVESNHCAISCLDEEDVDMLTRCIRLNMDCAEMCRLVAGFFARGSEHALHLLPECEDILIASARECDSHSHMKHCADCARICRECAEVCKNIGQSMAA